MSRAIREQARETGGRTLEMIAGTPRLNAWYYDKFRERISGRVLELGSGIGNISQHLAQDASELVCTDVEEVYVERLRESFPAAPHVSVHRYDLDEPPPRALTSEPFDVVISLNVLEHVADDRRAIRDLVSLLAPGGWLLTYVPAISRAYGTMDAALGHHRRYDRPELGARMTEADLQIHRLDYMNPIGLVGWALNGLVLKKQSLDARQVGVFERIVPLVRLVDRVPLPLGLGLVCHARKPLRR